MWSLLIITSLLFQSAVAIYLLNGVRRDDDIDKHLRVMLVILLVHLSTKFLLLAVLKDMFLYAAIPTGFSFAYGPLLLVITHSILGRPMRSGRILLHFIPFLALSAIYVFLIIAGTIGSIHRPTISGYAVLYEWLALISLYSYPIYVRVLLLGYRTKKARLALQISNILMLSVTAGLSAAYIRHKLHLPGFDLRLLPYICYAAIPVLILRYRLQTSDSLPISEPAMTPEASFGPPQPAGRPAAHQPPSPAPDRRYEKSGLDAGRMDEYEAALAAYMLKSRIYLDPDLSLEQLASRMKMSKHHLTQLLNERIMKNFYNFISEYRIGEAIDRLNNPRSQVIIESLAFDCGFNSRSSFNNYFKKITGHTPSAYRKLQLEQAGPGKKPSRAKTKVIPNTSASI